MPKCILPTSIIRSTYIYGEGKHLVSNFISSSLFLVRIRSCCILLRPSSAYMLSFNSPKTHFSFTFDAPKTCVSYGYRRQLRFSCSRSVPFATSQAIYNPPQDSISGISNSANQSSLNGASSFKDMLPKIDKSGRFCSPRAARELALIVLYAACLDGSDPVRLFEKRLNARREPEYEFDKGVLVEYNHMNFGGPPVTMETVEEADESLRTDQRESDIEAEVLSAPPKLVYSKLILRFTRKLLVAVMQEWDSNVATIDKVAPVNWKKEPAGRILEFSILHLAMSEITVVGTRHQIVINEAVDLAKRFCDGAAPRVINGCLRSFVQKLDTNSEMQSVKIKATI